MELQGKTAFISGGAKRIGRECLLALARKGCRIVLHYNRSSQEAAELASFVRAEYQSEVFLVQAELSSEENCRACFKVAQEQAGKIDLLINSASIYPAGEAEKVNEAELLENMQLNAWAPFYLMQEMASQKREGAIINFLDTRVLAQDRRHFAYHLSKRSLWSMTKNLALKWAPLLRINAIAPGLVLPPPGKGRDYLEERRSTNPLNAIGTLQQVRQCLLFLLECDFLTGQVIYLDGGRHLIGGPYAAG